MFKRKRKKDVSFQLIAPDTVAVKGLPETQCTLEEYDRLKKELRDFDPIPKEVFLSLDIEPKPVGDIPLKDKLFPYQLEGVKRAIAHGGRALIADEMGLGKSLQGIALALYYKDPFCVICPSYLRFNWKSELQKWGVEAMVVKKKEKPFVGNIIISYDIAHKVIDRLVFKTVICDESHYMKNRKSLRARKIVPMLKRTPHVFLLTGTPALNRPVELFMQMHAVRPFFFRKYSDYVHRYCNAHQSFLGFLDVTGSSNEKELALLLKNTGMIRRLKRDVLTQLPEKRRSILHVEGDRDPEIAALFEEWDGINRSIEKMDLEDARKASFRRQQIVSELFRKTCHAKIRVVKRVVLDVLHQGIPFIVFCYHKAMVSALLEAIPEAISITGDTPMEARQAMVDEFQRGEKTVAILSMLAAGTGLTLTACSTILFAETYFVPGVLLQAEDRCHRIGQKDVVDVRYIIAEHTLDSRVHKKVLRKIDTLDACVDGRSDRDMSFYESKF